MTEHTEKIRREDGDPLAHAGSLSAQPLAPRPATGGRPLDSGTRASMEAGLGHDFSRVRVHDDDEARAHARAMGADAVTTGADVYLGSDDRSDSAQGRSLLAHELAHVAQQERPGVAASVDRAEADASIAAERIASGQPYAVTVRAPAGVPLRQSAPPVSELTRARGTVRTGMAPDLGRLTGRQRPEPGLEPGVPLDRAGTEARLQSNIASLRPVIPVWTDTSVATGMSGFDSDFFGEVGPFDFRGRMMTGWEVNYYFVSMAMAHQGWDWNEAQAIIWSWNSAQSAGLVGGGGEMTPEMWFAAGEGFNDEQERMAQEASGTPTTSPAVPSP